MYEFLPLFLSACLHFLAAHRNRFCLQWCWCNAKVNIGTWPQVSFCFLFRLKEGIQKTVFPLCLRWVGGNCPVYKYLKSLSVRIYPNFECLLQVPGFELLSLNMDIDSLFSVWLQPERSLILSPLGNSLSGSSFYENQEHFHLTACNYSCEIQVVHLSKRQTNKQKDKSQTLVPELANCLYVHCRKKF